MSFESSQQLWLDFLNHHEFLVETCLTQRGIWVMACLCSALVGLSGLLPVIFLKPDAKCKTETDHDEVTSSSTLKFLLSFAVGSLLGDVFLHLLPEAYQRLYGEIRRVEDPNEAMKVMIAGHYHIGVWVIVGLLTFVIVEVIFSIDKAQHKSEISVSGYLNLLANCVDNFSHGLAVGAAFLVSPKVGLLTTVCILLHEIPHEIGDFAILLKSGFSRYDAAKAQFSTASLGMAGAFVALALDSYVAIDSWTSWIIPFTCGGFLNIALVTVLPDLLEANSVHECGRTLGGILLGLLVMNSISFL